MFKPEPFYNREAELQALERAWAHPAKGGQMAMVYGRRRLGKTYLLQRFVTAGDGKPACYYLAEQTSALSQRLMLAEQLLQAIPNTGAEPAEIAVSWNALLRFVTLHWQDPRRFVLILDEFPYLVHQSPELPSILQAWWDREGVHSRVMVILCGSSLSVMRALGGEGSPLFGRFTAGIIQIRPFRYDEVDLFYAGCPHYGLKEKLTMYGILGGTPRYHALVDTTLPMDEAVVNLLMRRASPLEHEVNYLLGTEQIREPAPYNAVLAAVARGDTQYNQIQQRTGTGGSLNHYLQQLKQLGWLREEHPFGEQSTRRSLYRVADPFLRFYYRFIHPNRSALEFSDPLDIYHRRIQPYLSVYMGEVFEEICLQWLQTRARQVFDAEILQAGRSWSRDGRVEIDIVADMSNGSRLFAECKWSAERPVSMEVLSELQTKTLFARHLTEGIQPVYAIFSVGGFTESLLALAREQPHSLWLIGADKLL